MPTMPQYASRPSRFSNLTFPDKNSRKNTPSQVSGYGTKTSGSAVGRAFNGGTGTYAEKGGRAAAVSHNGSAWSKSIAYGGNESSSSSSPFQVSTRNIHTYTSGNASAGVIKGGSFAQAGPGGYAEAAYIDGSRYSMSVAYGGEKEHWWKKGKKGVEYEYSIPEKLREEGSGGQRGRIESYYPESSDEGEEFEDSDDEGFSFY